MKQLLVIIMAASISLGGCVCLGAGWVYEFDGVDDYVISTDTRSIGAGSMSIAAWLRADSLHDGTVIKNGMTSASGFAPYNGMQIYCAADGTLYGSFGVDIDSGEAYDAASTYTAGVWIHAVIVQDGTADTLTLYINGSQAAQVSTAVSDGYDLTFIRPPYVGVRTGTLGNIADLFDGQIHAARIYNRALTAAEVRGLYKAGGGRNDFGNLSIVLPRADDQSLVFSLDRPADTYSTGDTVVEVRDSSPSGNDGTLEPSVAAGPVWSADRGGAYDFDGSGDYVTKASGFPAFSDFTVSAWVNADNWSGVSGTRYIMSQGYSGDNSWLLFNKDTGVFAFILRDGSTNAEYNWNTAPITGQWYHLSVVRDNTTISFYVDGALDSSAACSAFTVAYPRIDIGWAVVRNKAGVNFDGQIADPRIYSSALTSNQVYNLSQGIAPTNTPVLHYPFSAPSYSITSKDASRNYGEAIGGVTIGPAAIATPAP